MGHVRVRFVALMLAALACGACLDWDALSREAGKARACVAFVVAGDTHTCARRTDGSLDCWGDNRFGQLGTGDLERRAAPTRIAVDAVGKIYLPTGQGELSSDRAVFTCSLSTAGALDCWGDNRFGQLGTGDTQPRPRPARVKGLATVERAAAGAGHACAQTSDGALYCWGNNQQGQLGVGSTASSPTPAVVTGLDTGVASVTAGGFHTCALRADGRLSCWGSNEFGQVAAPAGAPATRPTDVDLGARATRIAAGADHTCAIVSDGTVRCWGDNRFGQLGSGDAAVKTAPVAVALPASATQIYPARTSTCALLSDASLHCWGANRDGQLGTGDTTAHAEPVRAGGAALASGVAAAYAGGAHACAVRTDGALFCWGSNQYGQLGAGAAAGSGEPRMVAPKCP
jgi:alpha-tubulin suppressor-like RCC1 family protein